MLLVYTGSDRSTLSFDYVPEDDWVPFPRLVVIFDRDVRDVHWYYVSESDSGHGPFDATTMQRFGIEPMALTPADEAVIASFIGEDPQLAILVADTGLVRRDG